MIISISKRFIFIANSKTSSTSIEYILAPHSDIFINVTHRGKHAGISEICSRFRDLFLDSDCSPQAFYKWGVIRNPVDWTISWFNYRSRDELSAPRHAAYQNYCGNISFEEFVEELRSTDPRPFAQIGQQKPRFVRNGALAVDRIALQENLSQEMIRIGNSVGVPELGTMLSTTKRNVSRKVRVQRHEVSRCVRAAIESTFAEDCEFYHDIAARNKTKSPYLGYDPLRRRLAKNKALDILVDRYRPDYGESFFLKSKVLQLHSRADEATIAARRAIELDPARAAYHSHLAELYRAQGKPTEESAARIRARKLQDAVLARNSHRG